MTGLSCKWGGNMDWGLVLTVLAAAVSTAALQLLKRKLLSMAKKM
jgi:hypothetical protein